MGKDNGVFVELFLAGCFVAMGASIGIATAALIKESEIHELRAALISHNLGEYYSDEPGAAPDKFRLIEQEGQTHE